MSAACSAVLTFVPHFVFVFPLGRACCWEQVWAKDMIESVRVVDEYVGFFCDYILQLSRRKYGGLSALCRIMPNALPITSDYTSWTLNDCIVTGIKQRPCFEIMSGKHGETSSFVHHAEIQCCQSIWTCIFSSFWAAPWNVSRSTTPTPPSRPQLKRLKHQQSDKP